MSGIDPEDAELAAARARRRAERERQRAGSPGTRRRAAARTRPTRGVAAGAHRRRRVLVTAVAALIAVAGLVAVAFALVGRDDPPPTPAVPGGTTHAVAPDAPARALGPTVSGAAARHAVIPILMYHVIAEPPAGTPYPELWVSATTFRAQMRALAHAGYHGITLAQAFAAWHHGAQIPEHPVVVSFDDGYRSHSASAAPVLRTLGWPGVLNLAIHNAGPDGISMWRLRGLVRDGWEIDSHSVTHADLPSLAPTELRAELVRSRAWIQRELGVAAEFFCYPAGRYDDAVVAAVRAAGYRGATTERPGPATARDDPYLLPRIRVARQDTAASLVAAVTPG